MTDDTQDASPRLQPGTRHGGGLAPQLGLPERWVAVLEAAESALGTPVPIPHHDET